MAGNKCVLGLDLGTNSIGWALIEEDEHKAAQSLIDWGTRVFETPLEADQKEPKAKARREKRGARRVISRRNDRRDALKRILRESGFMPENAEEEERLFNRHDPTTKNGPYHLRSRAASEEVEPHELGRALMHMVQRRGYQSNRRAAKLDTVEDAEVRRAVEQRERDDVEEAAQEVARKGKAKADNDDDEKVVLAGIANLQKALEATGHTLGQHLAELLDKGERVRGTHTSRQMYEHEFEAIWSEQKKHHAERLTDDLREQVHRELFFQRPLKSQSHKIGKCEFEAEEPRARRAHPLAQRFRILQDLTHLRYWEPDSVESQALSPEKIAILFKKLQGQKELTWKAACKAIKLEESARSSLRTRKPPAPKLTADLIDLLRVQQTGSEPTPLASDQKSKLQDALTKKKSLSWKAACEALGLDKKAKSNLASIQAYEPEPEKLVGNEAEIVIEKLTNGAWSKLGDKYQERLIADIFAIEDQQELIARLRDEWHFAPEIALDIAEWDPPKKTAALSLKAMKQIIPFMVQGMGYHDACQAAGYTRRDQREVQSADSLDPMADLRNSVVNRTLAETRKLLNALIQKYGKPDRIVIETAREFGLGKDAKIELYAGIKKGREMNEDARKALRERGIQSPSRDDVIKYRLWIECNKQCPYTGRTIAYDDLFNGDYDVEHILPLPRSLDDSLANKTLCHAEENRAVKRDRTPFEAYHNDPEKYAQIMERVWRFRCGNHKKKKFLLEELELDGFTSRNLNDTRYITRAVLESLRPVCDDIAATKGKLTSDLRHAWGLNGLLKEICPAPGLYADAEEDGDGGEEIKKQKQRIDHRHHAIDALVVALTSRSLYQKMARATKAAANRGETPDLVAPVPWEGFRADVRERAKHIVVSHRTSRKVSGALHEETAYGGNADKGFTVRKRVADLKKPDIERIVDPGTRKRVRAFAKSLVLNKDGTLGIEEIQFVNSHGVQKSIRRVKVRAAVQDRKALTEIDGKSFKLGSNHHMLIYGAAAGERRHEIVTTMEANRRVAQKEQLPQPNPPEGFEHLMTLHRKDAVLLEGDPTVYIVKAFAGRKRIDLKLVAHWFAGTARLTKNCGYGTRIQNSVDLKTICRRIELDPLGRIRER